MVKIQFLPNYFLLEYHMPVILSTFTRFSPKLKQLMQKSARLYQRSSNMAFIVKLVPLPILI